MPKILIDILPAKGHFHATLNMATLLKKSGCDVYYGSGLSLKADVEKFGFPFVLLQAVPVASFNFAARTVKMRFFLDYLYEVLHPSALDKLKNNIEEFFASVAENPPDLVLLDEQIALKAFLYETMHIQVVLFQTKQDTRKIAGLPPFTSYFIPEPGILNTFLCSLLWQSKLRRYHFNKQFNRILSLGRDNFSMYVKVCGDYGIEIKKRIELARSFGIGVKGFPRLIISPAAFDFPHPEQKGVFRIGPLTNIKREGQITLPRYIPLLVKLEEVRKNGDGFVVYCSLGTITAGYKMKVRKFFLKMSHVARINPGILFILSTGKDFDINELLPAPENLLVFGHVPQVDLLQYCHIMVTHGGMNSITECVFNAVPMLVYPLSPDWDQPGNSARVVFHGIGLRGRINRDSAKIISKKLNCIKSDYSFFKKNVTDMSDKFDEKNKSDEVVNIVENILNQSKKE